MRQIWFFARLLKNQKWDSSPKRQRFSVETFRPIRLHRSTNSSNGMKLIHRIVQRGLFVTTRSIAVGTSPAGESDIANFNAAQLIGMQIVLIPPRYSRNNTLSEGVLLVPFAGT